MNRSYSKTPTLIALDWGTTSLRAYLLDANGDTLEKQSAPLGILKIPNQNFDTAFEELCGPWLNNGLEAAPILASGMIGSRQGWLEAPYVSCPAGIDQLAEKLVSLVSQTGHRVSIVPGLSTENSAGAPDVMRGEETQIIGALTRDGSRQIFVLPGTHSKWVEAIDNKIVRFATFMTGEIFAVLSEHSILGRTMKGNADDVDGFRHGYDYAMNDAANSAGLLQQLFSARTLVLFRCIREEALHAYLSGLLIGSELRGALGIFGRGIDVTIIAEPALAHRYQRALAYAKISANLAADDAASMGLFRLARAAGLLK